MLLRLVESKESGAEKEFQHVLVKYVFFVVLVFVYAVSSKKTSSQVPTQSSLFCILQEKNFCFYHPRHFWFNHYSIKIYNIDSVLALPLIVVYLLSICRYLLFLAKTTTWTFRVGKPFIKTESCESGLLLLCPNKKWRNQ